MKTYLIFPSLFATLPEEKIQELKTIGEVIVLEHKGKISEIQVLKEDPEEKILGIDPDVVDWDLDVEDLDAIQNVKAICANSTSFEWIKPQELKAKGILAINTPKFSTDSVAEYIICLAICCARRLALDMKNNNQINWDNPPMLLKGKKMGIIGLGTIGKKLAANAMGIGMEVIYWSQNTRDDRYRYVEVDELFKEADVLVPTFAINEETKGIISKERLDNLKKSTILVGLNKSDQFWDFGYILEKVAKNELGGFAFEDDKAKALSDYQGNVWATPAIAWYSQDSLDNLMKIWLDGIIAVGKNSPINVVN